MQANTVQMVVPNLPSCSVLEVNRGLIAASDPVVKQVPVRTAIARILYVNPMSRRVLDEAVADATIDLRSI